jgi:TonB family protein
MRLSFLLIATLAMAIFSSCESVSTALADQRLELLHREPPLYPSELDKSRITGRVDFEFFVESDGTVREVRIIKSTHPLFSEQTVAAVRQWRFRPEIKGGIPVRSRIVTYLEFGLSP